jgi:hypothetical protein
LKEINLTQSKTAIVDDDDFPILNQFKWTAQKRDGGKRWYAFRKAKNRILYMHRFLKPEEPNLYVHHKNRNGLDNRKENLEIISHSDHCILHGLWCMK